MIIKNKYYTFSLKIISVKNVHPKIAFKILAGLVKYLMLTKNISKF